MVSLLHSEGHPALLKNQALLVDLRHDSFAGDLNMSPKRGGLGNWPYSSLLPPH